jgi:antitoxin CcdA
MDPHYRCVYPMRILSYSPIGFPMPSTSRSSRRKAVNLTIDQDVLLAARKHNLNLSKLLEETLRTELQVLTQNEWRQRNKEAIDAYNARVATHGVFSDRIRRY